MKRILVVLVVMGLLIGAVYGSAAALNVGGGILQAGADDDLVCWPAGVWVPAWGLNTLQGDYEGIEYAWIAPDLDGAPIADFIAACNGAKIFARVIADGNPLYSSGTMVGYSWVTVGIDAPQPTGVTGVTGWKLYIQDGQPGPLAYPLAEEVTEIKVWLEGGVEP